MTSEYVAINFELKVREIVAAAAALPAVDNVYSTTVLRDVLDEDARTWFWRELERQFDIVVTNAQRASLTTVANVVYYLKRRQREANG